MYSYILSSLTLGEKWQISKDLDPDRFVEKLIEVPEELMLEYKVLKEKFGHGLQFILKEPVTLSFSYLPSPVAVDLNTTINLIFKDSYGFMISSPRGIGLVTKGSPRAYVDTLVSQIIKTAIFEEEKLYRALQLGKKWMMIENWGEELRSIQIEKGKFGKIIMRGSKLQEKIDDFLPFSLSDDDSTVSKIRVFSKKLNTCVDISNRGVIRTPVVDINKITEYIIESIMIGDLLNE